VLSKRGAPRKSYSGITHRELAHPSSEASMAKVSTSVGEAPFSAEPNLDLVKPVSFLTRKRCLRRLRVVRLFPWSFGAIWLPPGTMHVVQLIFGFWRCLNFTYPAKPPVLVLDIHLLVRQYAKGQVK